MRIPMSMKKKIVYLLGILMILIGIASTLRFIWHLQDLFRVHLVRYADLFERGSVNRCLYLDVTLFLYVSTILFKNLYYILGGILLLYWIDLGRELGLLASFIGIITEMSFRILPWMALTPSALTAVSISSFFVFLQGISIPLIFIYLLSQKDTKELLKAR